MSPARLQVKFTFEVNRTQAVRRSAQVSGKALANPGYRESALIAAKVVPMQITPAEKSQTMPKTWCSDCHIPATLRTVVSDANRDRRIPVLHCPNCAKVIWAE
jgi:hypothetical protein